MHVACQMLRFFPTEDNRAKSHDFIQLQAMLHPFAGGWHWPFTELYCYVLNFLQYLTVPSVPTW